MTTGNWLFSNCSHEVAGHNIQKSDVLIAEILHGEKVNSSSLFRTISCKVITCRHILIHNWNLPGGSTWIVVRDALSLWHVKQTELWHVAVRFWKQKWLVRGSITPSVYGYGCLKGLELVNKCVSALNAMVCRTTFTLLYTIICFTVNIKKEHSNLTLVKDYMQNMVIVP